MNIFTWLNDYLIHRSNERQKEREHQLRLRELESEEIKESNVCQACETLKLELAVAHQLNRELLEMVKPKPTEVPINRPEEFKPLLPRHQSFRVKREFLEANDRHTAKILRDKLQEQQEAVKIPTPVSGPVTVESIERELGVDDADGSVQKASSE